MEEWQRHEKHDKQTKALLKELGFTNEKGQIWRWNGPKWWPRFTALGHDSMDFMECKCRRQSEAAG